MKKSRTAISLSKLSNSNVEVLLDHLGFSQEVVQINLPPTQKSVTPFEWGDRAENQQAEQYLAYLNNNIDLPNESEWYPLNRQAYKFVRLSIFDLFLDNYS